MDVTDSVLENIRELCLDYYINVGPQIRTTVVYGGAAKNYVGQNHDPGDFDLNIFFSKQSDVSSTYGMPKKIGEYQGLKVEVMRNKVPEDTSISEYVQTQESKRWQRIREEPVIQIHPNVEPMEW